MKPSRPCSTYHQGFFNAASALAQEVAARNHLHFLCELDASGMDAVRQEARRRGEVPPTYTAFVVKAAALALLEHPHLNCMVQETPLFTRLVRLNNVTATVAVERVVNGLDMVFASRLEEVAERTPAELAVQLRHFAEAPVESVPEFALFARLIPWARRLPWLVGHLLQAPCLSPSLWRRYRGGSFAVTSPAKYGGCDQVVAAWPWPLTFLFGAVKARSWVVNGAVAPRRTMRLTLTADRRLANGAPLARFAERVRDLLERPEEDARMVGPGQRQQAALPSGGPTERERIHAPSW